MPTPPPTATAAPGWSGSLPGSPCPIPDAGRYTAGEPLGRGGMGEVWRVYDRQLERAVALKVCHLRDASRFRAEILITARLCHPGIISVHDSGVLPDGRPWYTMREVPGRRTLADEAAAGREIPWLVRAAHRVAEALAHAHAEGVVHRDLKPANVLVGAFGEVLLADWGIAQRAGEAGVAGTRPYAPPEQLRGDPQGPTSDVYAFGALLLEILTGAPPYDVAAALATVRRRPDLDVLSDCLARCLDPSPEGRPADGAALARVLGEWVDGDLQRHRAREQVAAARERKPAVVRCREEAGRLERRARRLAEARTPGDPVRRKRPQWRAEDAARAAHLRAEALETALQQGLEGALELDPQQAEAHAELADLFRERLERAEARGDATAAAAAEVQLVRHDRGRHRDWLQGDGVLSLHTDPPGALVDLRRFVEVGRRLVERRVMRVRAPILALPLPRGSYVARVSAPGRAPVALPFLLGRREHQDQVAPGESAPRRLVLPERLGADDCVVPAGWATLGGDALAIDALPRARVWVEGFVIRRFATTIAEYRAFLDDLDADALDRWNPPVDPPVTQPGTRRLYVAGATGIAIAADLPAWAVQAPEHPVAHLSWRAASAYARWVAERSGLAWRLPTECEREKAARGADGRSLPWGEHFEPTWACVAEGFGGQPRPEPVHSHPTDVSVYGVRGLCGHVRDACANAWRRGGPIVRDGRVSEPIDPAAPFQASRGGAWRAASYLCRPAGRFGGPPDAWVGVLGVRLARSLPAVTAW